MAVRRHLSHVRSHRRRAAVPKMLEEREAQSKTPRVVYVTASATGKVLGYSTMEAPSEPTTEAKAPPKETTKAMTTPAQSAVPSKEAVSVSTVTPSTTEAQSSLRLVSTPSSTTSIAPTATQESKSGGLSTGATAGVAVVGVLIFLGLVGLAFFLYRKRQHQKHSAYAEMHGDQVPDGGKRIAAENKVPLKAGPVSPAPAAAAVASATTAPAVAQSPFNEKQPPSPVSSLTSTASAQPPQLSVRAVTDVSSDSGNAAGSGTTPAGSGVSVLAGAAAVGVAASALKSDSRKAPPPALNLNKTNVNPTYSERRQSANQNLSPLPPPPGPLKSPSPSNMTAYTDSSLPPSPIVATAAAASMVGAGTAAAIQNHPPPPPIYRVQMDFVPSMGDELELKVGQLVRVLHEYDDGWALCIRMDRSQQGVCPRTCLSQRPIKPRPPPGGPPGSRRPPPSAPGRQSPMGLPRAQSPALSFHSAQGRISPTPATGPNSHNTSSNPPSSPGGYNKPQYRPAIAGHTSPGPHAQSPAPQITVSTIAAQHHASSAGSDQLAGPPSPTNPDSVPNKSSPLSNVAAPNVVISEPIAETNPLTVQETSAAPTPVTQALPVAEPSVPTMSVPAPPTGVPVTLESLPAPTVAPIVQPPKKDDPATGIVQA